MKDETEIRRINKKLHEELKKYRKVALIALLPLFICGIGTILYGRIYEANTTYGIGLLITTLIGVCNFILILYYRRKFKRIEKIIEEEKKAKTKIISKENYKLLPLGYKRKRKKIDFNEE